MVKPREYASPAWAGEDLAGCTLFVYPEQGYGDAIQFARYLPMLVAKGAKVAFEAPAPLRRLFEAGGFVGTLVGAGEAPLGFDCHAALLDLPGLLGADAATIPPPGGVLGVPEDLVQKWAARIGAPDGLRVGIVWAGRPTYVNDRNRSLAPDALLPLAEVSGLRLYSLQLGHDGAAEAAFGGAVADLAPHIEDFADMTAAMLALDLVISVDTSAAHLAGALGRPVWTLLPFTPDWRWQLERDDSPWYPAMRLFRQQRAGDWPDVIARVADALAQSVE